MSIKEIWLKYKTTKSPYWAGQLAYLLGFEPDMEIVTPQVVDKDLTDNSPAF